MLVLKIDPVVHNPTRFLIFSPSLVSLSDPQFPLYNDWIKELLIVIGFLLACFALPIFGILLEELTHSIPGRGTRLNLR